MPRLLIRADRGCRRRESGYLSEVNQATLACHDRADP